MSTELDLTAAPLNPMALAELLRDTARECRATLEDGERMNDQAAIAVDLVADIAEEVAVWIERGPDLDATPHLAAILTMLSLIIEPLESAPAQADIA